MNKLQKAIQEAAHRAFQEAEDCNHDAGVLDRWAERAAKARDKAEAELAEAMKAAEVIGFVIEKPSLRHSPSDELIRKDWSE